jgi:hypothetical protein
MDNVIKGLEKIRAAIVGGIIVALFSFGIGALNRMINDISLKIITLILFLLIIIWSIILIYQFFSGFGSIRRANLISKLNERIDQLRIYMVSSILLGLVYMALVLLGGVLQLWFLIYIGFAILIPVAILSFLGGYRAIQTLGILGVYADNTELKNQAVSMLFLFKIQIANVILSNAASFFKNYLDIGYYFILIPSLLFSLYIFVMYVGILNLSIDVYKRIERNYA